ncbi:MAG TPA: methionyl-tRNA formyltransferase [Dehalococcoidia bacterium]|nr:methionyl-tRNA formyltransferase [Dehalococcoidia bacterium]
MRITFFGSPQESADALDSLIKVGHQVIAVYSQPGRRAGRGRAKSPTPVSDFALAHELPVFTPRGLRNNPEELARLAETNSDVFVVVAYGRILPPEVLRIPPMGVVNIHPSLLPRYRGPSPVVTAILDGQSQTGVTVMLLDEGMDTGPILAQSPPIDLDGTERGADLQDRLFKEGALLLPAVLEGLQDGSITPTPQNDALATVTTLLERSDGEIVWSSPAEQIDRMVRAYDPWPGTFTSWNGKGLKVIDVAVSSEPSTGAGAVSAVDGRLTIGTGTGALEITRLQIEGRQAVAAGDFLRGQPEINGATLGT